MRKWHAEWTVSRAIIVAGRCDTLNEQLLTWSSRYKNFKCLVHNKFFEVNIYQKDPVNHIIGASTLPVRAAKLICRRENGRSK